MTSRYTAKEKATSLGAWELEKTDSAFAPEVGFAVEPPCAPADPPLVTLLQHVYSNADMGAIAVEVGCRSDADALPAPPQNQFSGSSGHGRR